MSSLFTISGHASLFKIKLKVFCLSLLLTFAITESNAQCAAIIGANISPIEGCEILTVQFNDLSTGPVQSRTWNFGDGSASTGTSNPIHSFSAGITGDTSYIITLNTQCISGPPSIAYDTVLVYKKPKVNFLSNKTTLCALTDSACFINLSTFGPGYTCLWNFGDFTTSNQFQPCHIYTTGGVYSVQLTVTNTHGCANSLTFNNYVNVIPAPNLDFNISSFLGCAPMGVSFTNITDTVTTSFTSWQWNFGDGTPSVNAFNPSLHIFNSPGTYFISMSATNSLGCSNTTTKAIVVRTTPTSIFTATSPVCTFVTDVIKYTGNGGSGSTFSWNFAGGVASPGTGPGPHNTYWNNSGIMNVSLTVTDSGCSSSTTLPVIVNPRPSVTLSVSPNDTICQGQSVTFTVMPSTLTNYSFYKNSLLVQNSSSNTYVTSAINSGDSIYVRGTNSSGCTSLNSNVIKLYVNPLPIVTLTSSSMSVCSGDSLVFKASPSGYNTYSFYQGSLLLQSSPGNLYYSTNWLNGNSIFVMATNNGCKGDSSNIITPNISQPLPTPQVNCDISTDTTIQFTWLPETGATGYLVSVNGGPFISPSSGILGTNELVTGLTPGSSCTIRVIALGSGPCGNSDTSSVHTCYANNCGNITFNINPFQSICSGNNITLNLSGFNIPNPTISWNGGPSLPSNNSYTFSPTADTTIAVVVTNPVKPTCIPVTNYFIIHVNPSPIATLSINPNTDTICQGALAKFSASPAGYSNYSFYNGTTLLQSSNNTDYVIPNLSGNLSINLTTTYLGCQYTTSSSALTILPSPAVTLSSSVGSGSICFGDTLTASASPAGYSNYTFYNGPVILQNSSSNTLINSSMTGIGNSLSVVASDSYGCNSGSSNAFNYNVLPPPSISLSCSDADQIICDGDPVTFTALPTGMSSYQFFDGTTLLQNSNSNSFTTSGLLSGNSISVVGTNTSGCRSLTSNVFNINVKPRPNSFISASDTTICAGNSVILNANQNPVITGTAFTWSTGSTSSSVSYKPVTNTNYILYSNLNGCAGIPDTLSILVDNSPPPVATAGPGVTTCIGDSVSLSGSGGSNLFWTPVNGLSNSSITNPKAAPAMTTTYTLHTYNLYCVSTSLVTVTVDLCLTDIEEPIPTGITPNEDGTNDFFVIPNVEYFTKNSLNIYNRWGNIVFKQAPYNNDWNGKSLNGNDLPDAVYYYILDLGNGNKPHTGYILINR
jgi:gliding motility-associated-like protein